MNYKECNIFVDNYFTNFMKKIRNSKKWHCDFNQQCINILLAGQLENDEVEEGRG